LAQYNRFLATQSIENLENQYIGQKPDPLITVKTTNTVEEVLKVLLEKDITAVPVVDEKQTKTENGTPFVAIVNAIDLLTAFAFQPIFNSYDTDTKLSELKAETLKQVLKAQREVLKSPVSVYLGLSLEGKRLWTFTEKDTLDKLFDAFSVGVHRVLVSHSTHKTDYWTFVSQTDVLRYLKNQSYNRDSQLHEIFLQPISSLKLGTLQNKLFTFSSQHSAIRGFRVMLERNELSALPIVDESGKLVETLSASDFRFISLENLKDTLLPVLDFLKKERGQFKQTLVVATPDEPLYSVVDKLLLTGCHRLWVVDNEKKPIGVVSLTDIIRTFSDYGPLVNTITSRKEA